MEKYSEIENYSDYCDYLCEQLFPYLPQALPEFNFVGGYNNWKSIYHPDPSTIALIKDSKGQGARVYKNRPFNIKDYSTARGNYNVIKYYQESRRLDTKETLNKLAELAGVDRFKFGKGLTNEALEAYEKKQAAFKSITKEASQALFSDDEEAKEVLNYMRDRAWTDEEIKEAKIGYINETLKKKYNYAVSFPVQIGESHRLLIPVLRGSSYSYFKVRNIHKDEKLPKYLNSTGAQKDSFLAGIGFNASKVVIVEGELDALHVKTKGFYDIAATGGGALSENQILEIVANKRGINSLVLLFDNDEAGREFIKKSLDNVEKVAPQINCYIATLPETYKDTDDYFKAGNSLEAWKNIIDNARSSKLWEAEELLKKYGDDITDEARAALFSQFEEIAFNLKLHDRSAFFDIVEKNSTLLGVDNSQKFKDYLNAQIEARKEARHKEQLEKTLKDLTFENTEEGIKKLEAIRENYSQLSQEEDFLKAFAPLERSTFDSLLAEVPGGLKTGYKFSRVAGIVPGKGDGKKVIEEEPLTLREGLTFVVGYRGHYKTTFLNSLALEQLEHAKKDETILYYSLEIDKRRALANLLNTWVNKERLSKYDGEQKPIDTILEYYKNGKDASKIFLDNRDLFKRQEASFVEALSSQKLIVIGENYSSEELASSIRYYKKTSKRNIRAVFIDYVQLLESETAGKNTSRTDELKQILIQFRKLANEEGLPIIMACQTNRIESPSDLVTKNIGESGSIEREADTIIGLFALKEIDETDKKELTALAESMKSYFGSCRNELKTEEDSVKDFLNGTTKEAQEIGTGAKKENTILCRLMKRRYGYFPMDIFLQVESKTGKVIPNNTGIWKSQQEELNFETEKQEDQEEAPYGRDANGVAYSVEYLPF